MDHAPACRQPSDIVQISFCLPLMRSMICMVIKSLLAGL
uniref:Uncharacterized protein n=1 Tax=Anguilla anguilla TaxID=7936 RepID=A0A0E9TQ08_ANGAN